MLWFLNGFLQVADGCFWHFAVYWMTQRGRKLAGTAGTTEKEEAVISLFCSKIAKKSVYCCRIVN